MSTQIAETFWWKANQQTNCPRLSCRRHPCSQSQDQDRPATAAAAEVLAGLLAVPAIYSSGGAWGEWVGPALTQAMAAAPLGGLGGWVETGWRGAGWPGLQGAEQCLAGCCFWLLFQHVNFQFRFSLLSYPSGPFPHLTCLVFCFPPFLKPFPACAWLAHLTTIVFFPPPTSPPSSPAPPLSLCRECGAVELLCAALRSPPPGHSRAGGGGAC